MTKKNQDIIEEIEEVLKSSMLKKDFLINYPFKKLIVNEEDNLYINVSKIFLKEIENEYKKYRKNINDAEDEFRKHLDNVKAKNDEKNKQYKGKNYKNIKEQKFHFYPEILTKKSPITIIDGLWGTGKTFFIESFAKNIMEGNIKSSLLKNVIILDTWKYSSSDNVYDEIMAELFNIISKISNKGGKYLKRFAKAITNTVLIPKINNLVGIDINKIKKKDKANQKFFKKYDDDKEEITIIFFDNLERLGKYAWDVIKGIVKFSKFNNFVIVLPMNINGLSENKTQNEFPIEKFISLKYFKLITSYEPILKKANFDRDEIDLLNDFFNEIIKDKRIFSIRELEENFISFDILTTITKYEKLEIIFKKIKKSNVIIEENIFKKIDIYFKELIELRFQIYCFDVFIDLLETNFFISLFALNGKEIFEEVHKKIIEWRDLANKIKNRGLLYLDESSGEEMVSLHESFIFSLPNLNKYTEKIETNFLLNSDLFLELKENGERIMEIEKKLDEDKDMRIYLFNLYNKEIDLDYLKKIACEKIFSKSFDNINNSKNILKLEVDYKNNNISI